MIQLPTPYLSSKTLFNSRVSGSIKGEGKDVLDVAKVYTNRYALGTAANLICFVLSVHRRGCLTVMSDRPPGRT